MSEPIPESIPTSMDPKSRRPAKRRALSPTSQQSALLTSLFKKPTRPISIEPPKPKTLPPPPEIVANVQGSSAGAGSGEFHVYKASRRRENERIKMMEEQLKKEKETEEFERKKDELKKKDDEKTERNRKKREKKKQKAAKVGGGAASPSPGAGGSYGVGSVGKKDSTGDIEMIDGAPSIKPRSNGSNGLTGSRYPTTSRPSHDPVSLAVLDNSLTIHDDDD